VHQFSPGLWTNYDHAAYSSTLIPSRKDYPQLLGTQIVHGKVMGESATVRNLIHPSSKPLPFAQLCTLGTLRDWLHRLSLCIFLPAPRNYTQPTRECTPLTSNTLFRLLERLLVVGYPKHWLSRIFEPYLSSGTLSSVYWPPSQSPLPFSYTTNRDSKPHAVDVSIFQSELRVLASWWQRALALPMLCKELPPFNSIRQCVLTVRMSDTTEESKGDALNNLGFDYGHFVEKSLMLLVSSSRISSEVVDKPSFAIMRTRLPMLGEPLLRNYLNSMLRRTGRYQTERPGDHLQVVTTITFESSNRQVGFWMDEITLKKWQTQGWVAQLARCDSWLLLSELTPVTNAVIKASFDK